MVFSFNFALYSEANGLKQIVSNNSILTVDTQEVH